MLRDARDPGRAVPLPGLGELLPIPHDAAEHDRALTCPVVRHRVARARRRRSTWRTNELPVGASPDPGLVLRTIAAPAEGHDRIACDVVGHRVPEHPRHRSRRLDRPGRDLDRAAAAASIVALAVPVVTLLQTRVGRVVDDAVTAPDRKATAAVAGAVIVVAQCSIGLALALGLVGRCAERAVRRRVDHAHRALGAERAVTRRGVAAHARGARGDHEQEDPGRLHPGSSSHARVRSGCAC